MLPDMKPALLSLALFLASLAVYAQTEDRQLFLEGEGRFQSGDYELALDRYTELVREHPLSQYVPDAQFRRAVCLFELTRYREALTLFRSVAAHYSFTRYLPYVPFWIALTDYKLTNWSAAIDSFNTYLSGSDTTLVGQALLYKSVAERELGRFDDERATLERLMKTTNDPESLPYPLAELCALELKDKRYTQVLDLLGKVTIDKMPQQWRERLQLYEAEAYYNSGERAKAVDIYDLLRSAQPEIAGVAFQRLFTIYQASGDERKLSDVVSAADVALAGMPATLREFWLRAGIDSYDRGKYELAESYLERVWADRGRSEVSPLVPLYLAEIMAKSGRVQQAADTLSFVLKAGTPSPVASSDYRDLMLYRLGGFYLELSRWDLARKEFAELLASFPGSVYYAKSAYLDALAAYKAGDFSASLSSIDALSSAAKAGTESAPLLRLKADVYKALGDGGRAIEALREYAALFPNDVKARVDMVKLLFEQNDWVSVLSQEAKIMADFPSLAKSDPASYLLLRYLRGLVLVSQKSYAPAAASLSELTGAALKSADLGLIEPYTLFYRGWALYRLGEYAEAAPAFSELVARYPDNRLAEQALYLSGWCAYLQADFASSQRWFLRYANAAPPGSEDRDRGRFMYAKSLSGEKRANEAALAFQDIFVERPSSPFAAEALFEYAGILAVQGKTGEAAAAYERLSASYPASPLAEDALYRRGDLFYQSGKYAEAEEAFSLYRNRYPQGKEADAALYWGGRSALARGEDFGAALLWQKLIDTYKESSFRADAMVRTARIYEKRGDLRQALDLYNELSAVYPKEAAAVSAETDAAKIRYLLLGRSDREAELLVTIGKNGGDSPAGRRASLELARIYLAQPGAKQEQALPLLREVVGQSAADPASAAQAQFLMGEYYKQSGDLKRAANEYLKAATIDPSDSDLTASSMYRAAEMAKRAGDLSGAKRVVDQLVRDFPSSEWAAAGKRLLGGTE